MVDIITFLQHHKSFFQFCKLFSSFFRSKADALTRAMKIEQKMSKNFCEHYEHGEYALMKEWHDNLWNIIKKSAHL